MKRLITPLTLATIFVTCAAYAQQPPVPVFVSPVQLVEFIDEIEALGTLQANQNVELTATVTELVTKVNFEDNQRVKQGTVLVQMDAAEELAESAEERSRVDEAQRQVNRLTALEAKGTASKSVLDAQLRELQTAQARLQAIESRINERRVTAPFDGVVGLRDISVGALVQPGTLITTIDDDSLMKLDFSVPEIFLAALEPGIQVTAISSAYAGEEFLGKVSSIDSRVNPTTRSLLARALLDNPEYRLKAGMLMRVVLKKNPRMALAIPEEALIISGEQNFVMVVEDESGKTVAQRRAVEIGLRRKGEVEILAGLKEKEFVITHGSLRIRPGSEVIVKAVETQNETLTELLGQKSGKTD